MDYTPIPGIVKSNFKISHPIYGNSPHLITHMKSRLISRTKHEA